MEQEQIKHEILEILQKNARITEKEMGERLELSPEEISSQIRQLEEDGIIIGYHALVNEEKLEGAGVRALIEVEVQPERDGGYDPVALMISKFPEVKTVQLVSGRYDLRLEIVGNSLQEVGSFVASKLATIAGVKATVTHFLLKKYKEAGFRIQEDEDYSRLKVAP